MLVAKADPVHEQRVEFEQWIDLDGYDPNAVDMAAIDRALVALARKWEPKAAVNKKRIT